MPLADSGELKAQMLQRLTAGDRLLPVSVFRLLITA